MDETPPVTEWKKVTKDTYRLAVPGGWIYRYRSDITIEGRAELIFVPIPPLYPTSVNGYSTAKIPKSNFTSPDRNHDLTG